MFKVGDILELTHPPSDFDLDGYPPLDKIIAVVTCTDWHLINNAEDSNYDMQCCVIVIFKNRLPDVFENWGILTDETKPKLINNQSNFRWTRNV